MTQSGTIPKGLSAAEKYALRGDAPTMKNYLNIIETYEKIVNQDFSVERKEIEYLGYNTAVIIELSAAREYAIEGKSPRMNDRLNLAAIYSEITNQDISEQVAEIKALISD